jgi:hypothetical protein
MVHGSKDPTVVSQPVHEWYLVALTTAAGVQAVSDVALVHCSAAC